MTHRTSNIIGTLIGLAIIAVGILMGYLPCVVR
jgi:hypothetical protein